MRLWHKDLIPVLPRLQLLSQWRECCCIARNIKVNGTPNHLLVNKVLDYPDDHLSTYAFMVYCELIQRGYTARYAQFAKWSDVGDPTYYLVDTDDLFSGWHNDRYLRQCLLNLEEKFDCGGISPEEWAKIGPVYAKTFRDLLGGSEAEREEQV